MIWIGEQIVLLILLDCGDVDRSGGGVGLRKPVDQSFAKLRQAAAVELLRLYRPVDRVTDLFR